MKTIRSILRNIPVIKEYRLRDVENGDRKDDRGIVDEVLDLLLNISNWTRKPRDPCFTGLELRDRVKDVSLLVNEMHDEVGKGTFIPEEEKSIKRIKKGVDKCLAKTRYVAAGLMRVKAHLGKIVEVLDKPGQSSQEGLLSFKEIAEDLVKYVVNGQRTKFEKEFGGGILQVR